MSGAQFPSLRMRRLRRSGIREMLSEAAIRTEKLIYPVFVSEKISSPIEIETMPGQHIYPISGIDRIAGLEEEGIRAVMLFGVPARKDAEGSQAYSRNGVVQRAVRTLKASSSLLVITDLCMCEYTDTGHCGVMDGGAVDNDRTLEYYGRIALSQAEAGADIVAPSGMMDGQVRRIRAALDDGGYQDRPILSYASKMASSLYGPFREAAESAPATGDRRGYQMNPANAAEGLRELKLDEEEGADMLMVKPALTSLDILCRWKQQSLVPTGAFNVSGEYAMVRFASGSGALDYRSAVMEILLSIFRAGADFIVTYHAPEVVRWMAE